MVPSGPTAGATNVAGDVVVLGKNVTPSAVVSDQTILAIDPSESVEVDVRVTVAPSSTGFGVAVNDAVGG